MRELAMPFTEMTAEDFQAHLDQRSVNTHDAARVAGWFSEGAVQRRVATGEAARGRGEIEAAMAELFLAFPDSHLEVRDLFSTEDRMCVQCVYTGIHGGEWLGIPPSGRRVELEICLVFSFAEAGLVDEEVIYLDAATMLRQLGVLPQT